jgi:hypothetical protein
VVVAPGRGADVGVWAWVVGVFGVVVVVVDGPGVVPTKTVFWSIG